MPLPAKFFKYGSAPISRKQMMVLMWPIGCNGIINIQQQQECQQNSCNTPRGVGAIRFDRTFRKKNEEKPLNCLPTAALFARSGSRLYPHLVRHNQEAMYDWERAPSIVTCLSMGLMRQYSPSLAASCKAVTPWGDAILASTPAAIKYLQISACPFEAARPICNWVSLLC